MRKLICILLILVLSTISMCSLASELSEPIKAADAENIVVTMDEKVVVNNAHVVDNASRYTCVDCGWFCTTVCFEEERVYATGTHGSCEVDYLRSTGAEKCVECGKVWVRYGYHDCREIHKSCWKGNYNICPMNSRISEW